MIHMAVLTQLTVPTTTNENLGTMMPKLKYRFRVTFDFNSTNDRHVTTNVISATRPQLQHEEVTIDTYNSKIYLAGKHAWQTITVTLRDDVESITSTLLDNQISKQIDMLTQSSPTAGVSYKFNMTIDNLNGGNPIPEVLDTWTLNGCWLHSLEYQDSSYADGGAFQEISTTIRFDNAIHSTATNANTLTGGAQNNLIHGAA
jgi:hypothetical protein